MEREISFFAWYCSRRLATPKIPTWKIFTRKKSVEEIYNLTPYINYPAPTENDQLNLIDLYFAEKFSFERGSEWNKNCSKQIFMKLIACGYSSMLSTADILAEIFRYEMFIKMFVMFVPRKNLDQDLVDFIVEQNILNNQPKNLFWWIENLKIPKEKVFHTLEYSRMHFEYDDTTMELYKIIRKIKKYYKNKLLTKK